MSVVDTSRLAVGQEVYMYPGSRGYGYWKGKVVKITSAGVEVRLEAPIEGESLVRFGNWGTELMVDWDKWDCAPEQRPWILDDIPFADRTAELEQAAREL
jgi:hypothetical protein